MTLLNTIRDKYYDYIYIITFKSVKMPSVKSVKISSTYSFIMVYYFCVFKVFLCAKKTLFFLEKI